MGIDPNIEELTNVDMLTYHYYDSMTPETINEHAAKTVGVNKIYVIGEYGWSHLSSSNLDTFLSNIQNNENVTGDLYWSLFPHADNHGFVHHNDGFTLHYPGEDKSM